MANIPKMCCDWPKIEDLTELNKKVTELNNWNLISHQGNGQEIPKLAKKLQLKDFKTAIEYINKIAYIAEEKNHHPDLHLTSFRNLEIIIYTFSLKGLTENDFNLAKAFDDISI